MKNRLEIYLTIHDVADLCSVPVSIIDRLTRSNIHPPWGWLPSMKEPRFSPSALPEWLRILDAVDLNSLPRNPPPLQRPAEVFNKEQSGPTDEGLVIAARMLGLPVKMAVAG